MRARDVELGQRERGIERVVTGDIAEVGGEPNFISVHYLEIANVTALPRLSGARLVRDANLAASCALYLCAKALQIRVR